MTIQELIDILSKYDPNTPVVLCGYQSGYNDIIKIYPVIIRLNTHKEWYNGSHSLAPLNCPKIDKTTAIYLGGYNQNSPACWDFP